MAYLTRSGLGDFPEIYDSCCPRNDGRCPEDTRMKNEVKSKLIKLRKDLEAVNWRREGKVAEGTAAFDQLEAVENKIAQEIKRHGMDKPNAAIPGYYHHCLYNYSLYNYIKKDVDDAVFAGGEATGAYSPITLEEEMEILNMTLPPPPIEESFLRRNAKPVSYWRKCSGFRSVRYDMVY